MWLKRYFGNLQYMYLNLQSFRQVVADCLNDAHTAININAFEQLNVNV